MTIKFALYGTPTCKYCDKAKKLLAESNINYNYQSIMDVYPDDWRNGLKYLRPLIGEKHMSIPLVFVTHTDVEYPDIGNIDSFNGWSFIGSYFDLEEYIENMDNTKELTMDNNY